MSATTATKLETGLLLLIDAIYEGEAACETCGEPAVLIVRTSPDMEPGLACVEHAWAWIDMTIALGRKLYGPK